MLTNQEIVKFAPAAGARNPAPHCSGKYVMLPTLDAVDALREEGYLPVSARQDAVVDPRWDGPKHCRHTLRLRMERSDDATGRRLIALGLAPELALTNSSNASCPFSLDLAFLRQVCSNGLVVNSTAERAIFVHRYVTAEAVIERARQLSKASKLMVDRIKRWDATIMSEPQQIAFAKLALSLRVADHRLALYDPKSLLEVQREEDAEPTLWRVFNRVQENGMKGHITGRATPLDGQEVGRALSARPITAIGSELAFNRELWAIMERTATKMGVGA